LAEPGMEKSELIRECVKAYRPKLHS
jgi:hypothetical protein